MITDQELFAKGLATCQKVVRHDYMAHREVYRLLRDMFVSEAAREFAFLDRTAICCVQYTFSRLLEERQVTAAREILKSTIPPTSH